MRAPIVLLLATLVGCERAHDDALPKTFEECREIVRTKAIGGEYSKFQYVLARNTCETINAADPQIQKQLDAARPKAPLVSVPLTADGQIDFLNSADLTPAPGPLWP